jgi:F420H(2)-dependent quinone reductase
LKADRDGEGQSRYFGQDAYEEASRRALTTAPKLSTVAANMKTARDKQAELYEATNGEEGAELRGRPVIVLTSVGAKTRKLRKTPLMRVEHDGVYAVVASLGGAPKHPVWYHNLKKNPEVELQDRATKRDYVAREVTGDENRLWWKRAVETWPDYATYQTKTDRQIPVFVLEEADR